MMRIEWIGTTLSRARVESMASEILEREDKKNPLSRLVFDLIGE